MSFSLVEKLSGDHDVSDFDCGHGELNDWLRRYALTNQRAEAAQTYVVCQTGTRTVAGYYALAAGSVELAQATSRVARGLARHPIPIALLARLAVDLRSARKGLGSALLKDALLRINSAADVIGVRAVLVHAKDEAARAFYERYGFEPSPVDDLQLFLLIKDLRTTLRAARRQNAHELAEAAMRLADWTAEHGGLREPPAREPLPHEWLEEEVGDEEP